MKEIILEKRYPHSREEDITDAFMRGYEIGKEQEHRWWSAFCANCKTENSSEFLNNCEDFFREPTAEERKAVADYIDSISVPTGVNIFDLMDEPTISKMEQVETMSCAECKHRPIGAEICEEPCHYEPQTDWHYDEQDATWYPYKHEDEPQQKSCATCKHALGNWDGESNNCGRCCGADRRFYEPIEDEPQTERSE